MVAIMKAFLDDKNLGYRKKPYYLSNQELEIMCGIVNQIKDEHYTLTEDALVYKWKGGQTFYPHNASEFGKIAFSLADMHLLFQEIECSYCPMQFYTHFPNINVKTIKLMMYFFEKSNYICGSIKKSLAIALENLKNTKFPSQIIHGDAHPYNCLIDDENVTWIDYTDIHYDYRVIDLVWFIVFSVCWDEEYRYMKRIDLKYVIDFLYAYNSKNQLEKTEIEKMPYVFCILLVYSLFSVHSFWRKKKKLEYIGYNITELEDNTRYILEELKWNFHLQF